MTSTSSYGPAFRLSAVFSMLSAAVLFAVETPVLAQQAPIVMKMSTATLNDMQHEWYRRFGAEVEKRSGGRIKGEIYPASQLGAIPRQIEGVQFGSIQLWNGPPQFLAGVDSRFEVLSAPGLFKNSEHAHKVLQDPEFAAPFLAIGTPKGLKGVGLTVTGPISIATRTKATKLSDLAGKKIRVLASAIELEEMKRIKATAVPMSLGEVLPALQQGALDGTMSSLPVISAMRYYSVAKYALQTNHVMVVVINVASRIWFDKLPPDLQKVVMDAGAAVSRDILPWALQNYKEHEGVWVKGGGEISTLSPSEQAEIVRLMAPIGAEVTARKPEEKAMFDLLVKVAKKHQ
ncbi:MAG: TRAP transporter substrate-binding protein [Betaproteobacteria bacterium]|nr:TRAP transporter substrate-binding protein [Betaproteobacteria bacterium]